LPDLLQIRPGEVSKGKHPGFLENTSYWLHAIPVDQ